MSFNLVRCLSVAALLAAHAAGIAAPDRSRTGQVEVRLLSESGTVAPSQTIYLGLQQKNIPHWHTYWKNPGGSGTSTSIEWKLPAGVAASDIIWPAPSRFAIGPITNYGYADEVVLLTRLSVPASYEIGSTIPVEAKASWLVCVESCIPQEATLKLELTVAAAAGAGGEDKRIIDAARKTIPIAVAWPATYQRDGKALAATFELPAEIDGKSAAALLDKRVPKFYPSEWGTIAHNAAQPFKLDGRRLSIELTPGETPPSDAVRVPGAVDQSTLAA